MIPLPPSGKPVAFFDSESFPNFFLLKIRPQGGSVFSFSLRAGEFFSREDILRIETLFALFTVVSFNGIYYDVPVISAALCGFTCEQLKWISDEIILRDRKPWELGMATEWRPPDHIDVMEVLPGSGSQKLYAGRIHCKTMRDLPYPAESHLTEDQIREVDSYCGNDLDVLECLFVAVEPQLLMRNHLGERYGLDLRSKSDAQLAEAIIKRRCEEATGARIFKPEIDWNLKFRYEPPTWLQFCDPNLKAALELIKQAIFQLGPTGAVVMPDQLEGLEIPIGKTVYRLGIGGLHSKDGRSVHKSDETWIIRDADVASYYPNLILGSGRWPAALGPVFPQEYRGILVERLSDKKKEKALEKAGQKGSHEWLIAHCGNEGLKIAVNGTFGKTGSIYSILFAPEMLIQTTVTGQLALLMLIEWHEMQRIDVISANTDGIVIKCERNRLPISDNIIAYWEKTSGLQMETTEYRAIYARDVNNYFAVKSDGEVKRKGEYSKAGLIEKKNPNVEICADAVADFLSKGIPIAYTIAACRDIRKFVRIQNVTGGAVKLWGTGPKKEMKVRDMDSILHANGWKKIGRKWSKFIDGYEILTSASDAYKSCFQPQLPEYLGKVVRWYYGTNSPGSIVYNSNGNTVGLSYGAQPCMTLPDEFPSDIDYFWYLENCEKMLRDIGYYEPV